MSKDENLKFSKTHQWVKINGENATLGITDYAQKALGDITWVELPTIGLKAKAGENFCEIESVKTTSEVISPISGEVVEVNSQVDANPGLCNSDPFGAGWLAKIRLSELPAGLLGADEYADFIKNLD